MTVRTIAVDASSDMDRVDPTSSGAVATDCKVSYDDAVPIGKILTALENAKNVILKDLS